LPTNEELLATLSKEPQVMKLMRMILKISLSKKGENEVYNTTGITEKFPGGIMEFYKFVGNFKTQEQP
jgi:hypothetical protein